mgnify:CR=1 FL=1
MKKAWIFYTTLSVVFFLICLFVIIFYNKPVFDNLWEESLLLISILNLVIALSWFRRHKDVFLRKRKDWDKKINS